MSLNFTHFLHLVHLFHRYFSQIAAGIKGTVPHDVHADIWSDLSAEFVCLFGSVQWTGKLLCARSGRSIGCDGQVLHHALPKDVHCAECAVCLQRKVSSSHIQYIIVIEYSVHSAPRYSIQSPHWSSRRLTDLKLQTCETAKCRASTVDWLTDLAQAKDCWKLWRISDVDWMDVWMSACLASLLWCAISAFGLWAELPFCFIVVAVFAVETLN